MSNSIHEIHDVWNESNNEEVPDKKHSKFHNGFFTYDDRSLSISRKSSKSLKKAVTNHKQKHNVSLKFWHEVNTKKLDYVLVDNKQ